MGLRKDKYTYHCKDAIRYDTLLSNYRDCIPKERRSVIFNDNVIAYIDGENPEGLNISKPIPELWQILFYRPSGEN
ncbi:hypothetical protein FPE01S_01_07700 [Flavihumibacter petaseus NBRC 106054]|uniref:Uncharacterized protein n=1 Tax=Flavihumibacter petaseus NBRC 106054 TaxID=1220578 RepID=A0A0E9MWE1_9BACT|nr:hypothetical protein FPE01S_01_07700 [Flavihumibacter petaseus NBRC 106054]